jgi:hypothetical protein
MVNRPKAIGTAAETAVKNVLCEYFPDVDRRVLHGSEDHGDMINTGVFCFEVKGGEAAKNMKGSREVQEGKLTTWLAQTETERKHAGAEYGVLVTQRGGYSAANAGKWWAWVTAETFSYIVNGYYVSRNPVRMELNDFLTMIADQGLTPDAF